MLEKEKVNAMFAKAVAAEFGENDTVDHPSHYAAGRKYEPIDVIEDWNLGFSLGNVVKYISRAGRKNDALEDLRKAQFYLDYAIEHYTDKND